MPWAVGCLTRKNTLQCRAFLGECRAVFVDLFHFLLLLVTFFTGCKFCKLLFTGERGKVCYFLLLSLLLVTLINYFLLLRRARVKGSIHCATRELGWVQVDFLGLFFTVEGEGVEVNVFFSPRYMKRWKEEGGKGYI
jgi:hypothetical protein